MLGKAGRKCISKASFQFRHVAFEKLVGHLLGK